MLTYILSKSSATHTLNMRWGRRVVKHDQLTINVLLFVEKIHKYETMQVIEIASSEMQNQVFLYSHNPGCL